MVKAHPKEAYLLSVVFYYPLEEVLCKSSVAWPVNTDSVPVGGYQALIGFLGPERLLR